MRKNTDVLCYRLSDDGSNACKVLMSIDILCELGIFRKEGNRVVVSDTSSKVNLDDSQLMSQLKRIAGKDLEI